VEVGNKADMEKAGDGVLQSSHSMNEHGLFHHEVEEDVPETKVHLISINYSWLTDIN
jgi:hypothetical protein